MLQSMTISAPIPVPGTQQQPTTPSLGSTTSTTIIHINNNSGDLHKINSNSSARITTTIGTSSSMGVGSNNHLSSSSSNGSSSNYNRDGSKDGNGKDIGPGLRRFPSIGNTKKLHLENSTLRSKITELERYLQGLKEELILAHRQIHSKNLEAKISQERKAVEIHELGQHIQRCEFDLLAKTAECEALQNKLQYQTKEQVSKLRHINMLETEIMDYRRMSIMSGHGPSSTTGTGPWTVGSGGMVARGGSVLFRNSRNSSDLTESVRSSAVLQDSTAAVEEATAALQAQIKQLKDEHWKKDEQIQELSEKIQFLTDSISQLEKAASASAVKKEEKEKEMEMEMEKDKGAKATTKKDNIVLESTSNASFSTAATGGGGAISSGASHSSSSISIINSVGYDLSVEHPKLLSRYQALRVQHAQASEYLDQLESENQDLKVQLLDVSESVVSESLDVTTPTVENPKPIPTFPVSSPAAKEEEEVKEVEEATTPTVTDAAKAAPTTAAIAPSISRNSFHHPAASNLTPLDTVAANANIESTSEPAAASASSSNEGSSPTSAASSSSPSTVVSAPALTRKSSLRYSRDGQVSPVLNAAATNAP
ncbi:hypothetical protein BG015_009793 [Linnemannia schmuckeri]|uniref:Uncharacterized protein n=1 Tax=Linnemannia schmuckeri TaxID=64567 RepID=A0A9P5RXR0_9FUNG|nr:hypothetical protein BG015_009793 [Linnemannia schmuckeri]